MSLGATQQFPNTDSRTQPRVAVIGAGYWGKNLVRNFASLGALGMVVDVNTQAASALGEQYGAVSGTLEGALSNNAIEGVAIAAPASKHFSLAHRCLEAGKHVFVEK